MPVLNHFDLLAPWYDKIISYQEDEEFQNWMELPINGNLLDIGGGTGRVSGSLVNKVNKLVIVDASYEMLKMANKKGFSTICALGEGLPYEGGAFERVLIVDVLHHCNDQETVFHDAWRILKPGGFLAIVEPNVDHLYGKMIRIFEMLLVMRSKFLSDRAIVSLVQESSKDITIKHVKGNSWIKVYKGC